jgi:alpha-beta hydrolase superfamily lysophospholipase
LSGCAAIPYGHPHAAVTSGVFMLADGVSLPYRVYPASGQVRVVVLALHGYTDSRDAFVYLAGDLNPHGVTIYAPDQSSFGATGGGLPYGWRRVRIRLRWMGMCWRVRRCGAGRR